METPVETGWVNLAPYLQVTPSHPLVSEQDPKTKQLIEIYEHFREVAPSNPMSEFIKIYNRLPMIPEASETKLEQVMKAVRLMRMSREALQTYRNTNKALKTLGVRK